MDLNQSSNTKKKVKVIYTEGEKYNLYITQDITFESLIAEVCSKINKSTYDGSSVKEDDVILSYKDGNEVIELVDVSIIFENEINILYVNIREYDNNFANYEAKDYVMEILYNYDPQDSLNRLKLWHNSAKEMIEEHLYQCVYESNKNPENVKYIISLFYILYKYFKYEKVYISIINIVSKIEISRIIISNYILKLCDEYYERITKINKNGENSIKEYLLRQSLCFLSLYQQVKDEKWEIKTTKSIIDKLKPIEIYLSIKLKKYYEIINNYLILYDDNAELVEGLPIIPTYEEIHSNEDLIFSMLKENKLNGYKSVREYLSTHYLLLRADVLLPLQQTVNIASNNNKNISRNSFCFSYKNVNCISFDYNMTNGMLYLIEFDKPYAKLRWRYSKRLQYGTLLCITPDNYKTLIWCTLANRKSLEDDKNSVNERPQITVKILSSSENSIGKLEFGLTYQMAESPEIFFEAYKYTLMSLRKKICSSDYELPFKSNLVDGIKYISNPSYIDNFTTYKMDSVFPDNPFLKILGKWPSYEECINLDESQLEALQNMLTKEISLVQGPPGTGKTYVGSLAVKLLLENHYYNGPILVVCYTNHALDQFLETFVDVCTPGELVRIGGRCKSEILEKYSLNNQRNERTKEYRKQFWEIKNELEELKPRMDNSISLTERNELKRFNPLKLLPYIPYSFFKQYIGTKHFIGLNSFIEEEEDPSHLWAYDPLFKWLNQIEYNQMKDDDRIEIMFKKWFNLIHFSEDEFELCEEEDDDDYDDYDYDYDYNNKKKIYEKMMKKIEKAWLKNAEKESDYYSIYRKYLNKYIQQYRKAFEEYMNVNMSGGLWSLNQLERESLYNKWIMKHYPAIHEYYQIDFEKYKSLSEQAEKLKISEEVSILKNSKMIGMTTTGAARLIDMINELEVEVIVIEEAGEVLEAHTLALFCKSLKHLILIGDHKQLRPSVVNFNLENKYKLTRSLFERLVLNGVDKVMLKTQRRMRPEISDLIRCSSLYPNLKDHRTTLKRPNIRGLVYNVYFFNHKILEPELQEDSEENHSKVNEFECQMIIHFMKYLVDVGYKPNQITILSFYLGQCQLIYEECCNLLGKETAKQFRIIAVDNFQGEENDIIIFSAVRSNLQNKIGFCRVENRVNVALSRARNGLFMFGNMDCLITGSHNRSVFPETNLWDYIKEILISKNMIGNSLPLVCPNHNERFYSIEKAEDFDLYCPTGTCGEICKRRMECGHSCKMPCHLDKCEDHCEEQCIKILSCNHQCKGKCSTCRNNHKHKKCVEQCDKELSCGHKCQNKCGEECTKECNEVIEVKLPCGHKTNIKCFMKNNLELVNCLEACNTLLPCNHICEGNCFECKNGHIPCKNSCERTLECGHSCKNKCGEECIKECNEIIEVKLPCEHKTKIKCYMKDNLESIDCFMKLEKTLECGHIIKYKCCDKEKPNTFQCKSPCKTKLECNHICEGNCYKCKNGHIPCSKPCERTLECGHKCQNKCGEECTKECKTPITVTLLCGHEEIIKCYKSKDLTKIICNRPCKKLLPCGHDCKNKCSEECTEKCMKKVNEILLCKHQQKIYCYEKLDLSSVTCNSQCEKILECGHTCKNKCGEECTENCKVIIKLKDKLPCGHIPVVQCYKRNDPFECNEKCNVTLPCGHRCRGSCSKCKDGHIDCDVCSKELNERFERISINTSNRNKSSGNTTMLHSVYDDILKVFTYGRVTKIK